MMYPDIPERAISVMNPWCGWLALGLKPIENRDWRTKYRGPVALHASKKLDRFPLEQVQEGFHPASGDLLPDDHPLLTRTDWGLLCRMAGGIIGVADVIDCVDDSDDDWFVGRYGFVLANARPVPFIPVNGALGFFDWRKQWEKDQAKLRAAA